jgi:hypothetical protein
MHAAGVATGAEWRDAHGMDPDGDPDATHGAEGLRMHLKSDGTPLPSARTPTSAGLKRAAGPRGPGSRRRARTRPGGRGRRPRAPWRPSRPRRRRWQPTAMPWQPADPEHPDTQAAMAEHDDEHGIGPRNVQEDLSGTPRRSRRQPRDDRGREGPRERLRPRDRAARRRPHRPALQPMSSVPAPPTVSWSTWAEHAQALTCPACNTSFQPNHPRRRFCGKPDCPGRPRKRPKRSSSYSPSPRAARPTRCN